MMLDSKLGVCTQEGLEATMELDNSSWGMSENQPPFEKAAEETFHLEQEGSGVGGH